MSPPPLIQGVFTQTPVSRPLDPETWEQLVRHDPQTSRCFIERVMFCKCNDGKEHEFLKVYVRHPTHDCTALLVLDRVIDLPVYVSNSSRRTSSTRASTALRGESPASDQIAIALVGDAGEETITAPHEPYKELGELTFHVPTSYATSFSHSAPSARNLSILLQVVNRHAPTYSLREHQCYWFANIIFETLKNIFEDSLEKDESFNGGNERSRRGQLGMLSIASVNRSEMETIIDDYKKSP